MGRGGGGGVVHIMSISRKIADRSLNAVGGGGGGGASISYPKP